jgi:hypothetical protein
MHYILPAELLKKKDKEAGEGPSSGPEPKKPDALVQSDSEEEEEIQQLERRKIPTLRQLPDDVMLSGADVNQILGVVFGTEPLVKRPRTGVSPNKPLNPQPLASVTPRTHTAVKATTIIDIQDDPEPETFPSTFVTEHPPSPPPPQSPNPTTTSPPQTTTPEPMQLDQPEIVERGLPGITQESPKPTSEVSGPDPKASEPSMKLNDLNLDTQEQQPELFSARKRCPH